MLRTLLQQMLPNQCEYNSSNNSVPLANLPSPDLPHTEIVFRVIWLKNSFQARALRALGLLLADDAPTVGRGKTF